MFKCFKAFACCYSRKNDPDDDANTDTDNVDADDRPTTNRQLYRALKSGDYQVRELLNLTYILDRINMIEKKLGLFDIKDLNLDKTDDTAELDNTIDAKNAEAGLFNANGPPPSPQEEESP